MFDVSCKLNCNGLIQSGNNVSQRKKKMKSLLILENLEKIVLIFFFNVL